MSSGTTRGIRPRRLAFAGGAVALVAAVLGAASGEDAPAQIRRGPQLTIAENGDLVVRVGFTRPVPKAFVRVLDPDPARNAAPTFDAAPVDTASLVHEARLTGIRDGAVHRYAVVAEGVEPAWFELKAPPATSKQVRIAVLGDSGYGTNDQLDVARLVRAQDPDFVLHTGDVIYPFGQDDLLDGRFFKPYAPLLSRLPFFTSLGNHDTAKDNGKAERTAFAYPPNENDDFFYSFDWGPVHVTVLDSNPINYKGALADTAQGRWLENDLASSTAEWKLVVFHHPLYSCVKERLAQYAKMRALVEPIFVKHGVGLVLCGHDHFYYRTPRVLNGKPDPAGIVNVVTGGGGATLYDGAPDAVADTTAKFLKRHHAVFLEIDGSKLRARVLAPAKGDFEPELLDEFEVLSRRLK